MTSDFLTASATFITFMPSFTAASQLFPGRSPMTTSSPESFKFSDCPRPWEPYPITAIFLSFRAPISASDS